MAFSPGLGSGGGSLAASSDVALNALSNEHALTFNATSSKWINQTLPGSEAMPGLVHFDSFSGTSDSARITNMNAWAMAHGGEPLPAVVFSPRQHNFNTPIKLFSGLKLVGGSITSAREFGRTTILNYQGNNETSMFVFPTEGQTNQDFPTDNSPRDISVAYMILQGRAETNCLPKHDPTTDDSTGRVLWNSNFHRCGFRFFNTIWHGWGQGTSISGETYIQAIGSTGFFLGGANNRIYGKDAYSMTANTDAGEAVPFIRSVMSDSYIGKCLITSRKGGTCISVEGGSNLVIEQTGFDAQSSDPIYGAGLIISGGDGITVSNCTFKGVATNPSGGWGGAAGNKGWIHVSGGSQITFNGNNFHRQGNNMPATSYPLVYATSGVSNNGVKWSHNGYSSFDGNAAVVRQQDSGKIIASPDPLLNLTTGA